MSKIDNIEAGKEVVLDVNGEDESPEIGSPPIWAKQKVKGRQYIIDCLMNVTKTNLGE